VGRNAVIAFVQKEKVGEKGRKRGGKERSERDGIFLGVGRGGVVGGGGGGGGGCGGGGGGVFFCGFWGGFGGGGGGGGGGGELLEKKSPRHVQAPLLSFTSGEGRKGRKPENLLLKTSGKGNKKEKTSWRCQQSFFW